MEAEYTRRTEYFDAVVSVLRKYECTHLVDLTLTDLSPSEDGLYRAGLGVVVLHLALAAACYAFDYVLFWIMALIEYHARPSFDVTGQVGIDQYLL